LRTNILSWLINELEWLLNEHVFVFLGGVIFCVYVNKFINLTTLYGLKSDDTVYKIFVKHNRKTRPPEIIPDPTLRFFVQLCFILLLLIGYKLYFN